VTGYPVIAVTVCSGGTALGTYTAGSASFA